MYHYIDAVLYNYVVWYMYVLLSSFGNMYYIIIYCEMYVCVCVCVFEAIIYPSFTNQFL